MIYLVGYCSFFCFKERDVVIEEKIIDWDTDFGYVESNLQRLMDKQGITISTMSHLTNIKYEIVKKYYYGENYAFNCEILAKFCYILDCNIADIIYYVPSKDFVNKGDFND